MQAAGSVKRYLTGDRLSRSDADQMIADYYSEWGWDAETGVPTEHELERLELSDLFATADAMSHGGTGAPC